MRKKKKLGEFTSERWREGFRVCNEVLPLIYRHWHEVSIPIPFPWQFRVCGPVNSRCGKKDIKKTLPSSETRGPQNQPQSRGAPAAELLETGRLGGVSLSFSL